MRDLIRQLPKVELHLHLEGAVPAPAMMTLVERHGGHPEVPDLEALKRRFVYRDFPHFLATWDWKNQFIKTPDDFEHIARAVSLWLARYRVVYAEAFFSPGDFRLRPAAILEALDSGLAAGQREGGTRVNLIVDLIRDLGPVRGGEILDELLGLDCPRLIGVGIGGSEHRFPPDPYAELFARARRRGLHLTAHAGEAAGPESVAGALDRLGVERIGHGVRAIEDPFLVERLASQGIALEVCPTSNLRTGLYSDLAEHPALELLRAGVRVTINTDDPAMFGTDMNAELLGLAETFDLGPEDLVGLQQNARQAAFRCPDTLTCDALS